MVYQLSLQHWPYVVALASPTWQPCWRQVERRSQTDRPSSFTRDRIPQAYDLVKSYGADDVFNYRDKVIGAEIAKRYTDIKIAVDCFSECKSIKTCNAVIGQNGGLVITLLPTPKSSMPPIKFSFGYIPSFFATPLKHPKPCDSMSRPQ
jgi:hypothetical protein